MIEWTRIEAERARRAEMLHAAAHHHRLRENLPLRDMPHCRALAWIGHRLAAWGAWLERRYGHAQAAIQPVPLRATQEMDCC